ncbi:MAG: hypothetical protein QOI34_1094, partial [Verrucomicrobiota bacterium]
ERWTLDVERWTFPWIAYSGYSSHLRGPDRRFHLAKPHDCPKIPAFILNMKVGHIVSKWVPVIAWMLLIFAGSSDALSAEHTSRFLIPFLQWLDPTMSYHTIAAIHFTLRKIGHFTEYAILAALLWRALYGTFTALSRRMVSLCTFLVAASFAASDEFHQSFVLSRTSSAHDVMIDCFGVIVAVTLCALLSRARSQPALNEF